MTRCMADAVSALVVMPRQVLEENDVGAVHALPLQCKTPAEIAGASLIFPGGGGWLRNFRSASSGVSGPREMRF